MRHTLSVAGIGMRAQLAFCAVMKLDPLLIVALEGTWGMEDLFLRKKLRRLLSGGAAVSLTVAKSLGQSVALILERPSASFPLG